MATNFEDVFPVEALEAGRPRPSSPGLEIPARPVWNWEELNAKFRPRLVAAGVIRFGLSQEECEEAAQKVFLRALAQNPRVRDPKAFLRAAFLSQCYRLLGMEAAP